MVGGGLEAWGSGVGGLVGSYKLGKTNGDVVGLGRCGEGVGLPDAGI